MVENLPAIQETWIQIPGSGRFHREGNGYPLQYSCLENSMDRGAWRATVHVVAELDATERVALYASGNFCFLVFQRGTGR